MPQPLHELVEQLCETVYEAGEPHRPTKMEMIGALLLAAPRDPDRLIALLRNYGKATVGDALGDTGSTAGTVIELPERKPGPRSSPGR